MSKAGKRLLRAAGEMRAIARGETEPARIHVPPDVDVKAVRRKLDLSQEAFASEFSFSIAQIKDWEQGRSRPLDSNRAYLLLIDRRPGIVRKILAEMRAEAARQRETNWSWLSDCQRGPLVRDASASPRGPDEPSALSYRGDVEIFSVARSTVGTTPRR